MHSVQGRTSSVFHVAPFIIEAVNFWMVFYSLVPRPSPAPVFDRFRYAKTEGEVLVNLAM